MRTAALQDYGFLFGAKEMLDANERVGARNGRENTNVRMTTT
jgi:hypothetical protein